MSKWTIRTIHVISGLLFVGVGLEILAAWKGLPHIPQIFGGWVYLWTSGTLPHDILVSSARWLTGWSVGAALGVSFGLLTGRSRIVRLVSEGSMIVARSIPFISLVPLVIRIWGSAEIGKIALVAWASATICWIVVHQAALNLPADLKWRSVSLGVSGRDWIFKVLIPECHTAILSALRTSLTLGLLVVAVAEIAPVLERKPGVFEFWSEGLGYRLFRTLDQSRDDFMLATILTFAVMGVVVEPMFVSAWRAGGRAITRARQRRVKRLLVMLKVMGGRQRTLPPALGLSVRALSASYGESEILRDLQMEIAPGETLSLVGPSGCGKSTLIRSVGHFTDGSLSVRGSILVGGSLRTAPGPWVGVVWQDAHVFGHLTVFENAMMGAGLRNAPIERKWLTWNLLERFGIGQLAAERAAILSSGQRQRLALAAAVANEPEVLLLDEPFGALDAITRRQMQSFYWKQVHGRVTAVFVTHDLEEAMIVGDVVRVGIHGGAREIRMEKCGLDPHEWEKTSGFDEQRRALLMELETVASLTDNDRSRL